jgi:hypothetical protein
VEMVGEFEIRCTRGLAVRGGRTTLVDREVTEDHHDRRRRLAASAQWDGLRLQPLTSTTPPAGIPSSRAASMNASRSASDKAGPVVSRDMKPSTRAACLGVSNGSPESRPAISAKSSKPGRPTVVDRAVVVMRYWPTYWSTIRLLGGAGARPCARSHSDTVAWDTRSTPRERSSCAHASWLCPAAMRANRSRRPSSELHAPVLASASSFTSVSWR